MELIETFPTMSKCDCITFNNQNFTVNTRKLQQDIHFQSIPKFSNNNNINKVQQTNNM